MIEVQDRRRLVPPTKATLAQLGRASDLYSEGCGFDSYRWLSYCSLTYKEKQIMETLSFILGIAFVVVIATAIVAVYAFVKVISVQKSNKELDQRFADVYQTMAEESRQINQRVDHFEKDIYSQLDSRLDKLVDNLKKQKALI